MNGESHAAKTREEQRKYEIVPAGKRREGRSGTMIHTSNAAVSDWPQLFTSNDRLLCTIDRILEGPAVFMVRMQIFYVKGLARTRSEDAGPQPDKQALWGR